MGSMLATTSFITKAQEQISAFGFPLMTLHAGSHTIEAEVAATENTRMQGLMYRSTMEQQHGMVFLFEQPSKQCMWMRNTLIALSVAFIDNNGKIINIEDMSPQTDDNHCSTGPAKYALEMNQGWFSKNNVKTSDTIKDIQSVKAQTQP